MPSEPMSSEPWMRGPLAGISPLIAPVFFSFEQVREDLAKHANGLTREQVWTTFQGASIGFHIRHLGGSVERLTAYLLGRSLDESQLAALQLESESGEDIEALTAKLNRQLESCEEQLRTIDPATIYDKRTVGRQALPTTVIGLIVHICEHSQRHLGQAVTLAKLLRSGA